MTKRASAYVVVKYEKLKQRTTKITVIDTTDGAGASAVSGLAAAGKKAAKRKSSEESSSDSEVSQLVLTNKTSKMRFF